VVSVCTRITHQAHQVLRAQATANDTVTPPFQTEASVTTLCNLLLNFHQSSIFGVNRADWGAKSAGGGGGGKGVECPPVHVRASGVAGLWSRQDLQHSSALAFLLELPHTTASPQLLRARKAHVSLVQAASLSGSRLRREDMGRALPVRAR